MPNDDLKFVKFDENYLAKSWEWLNDPEIKKLTNTPDFTQQQQRDFFSSLPRSDYKIWGLAFLGIPIGAVGLKKITSSDAEYFGYIGEKQYWGKGLFKNILLFVLLESKKLGVDYLYLNVCADNKRALRAYQREGFIVSEDNGNMVKMTMRIL